MDIYRFFHPHHNPRLLGTAIRQQEISELEQAGAELLKAVRRAQQRSTRRCAGPILPQHFTDIVKALQFVVSSLSTLCDAHPGDTLEELSDLISERADLPGWANWTNLVREQISFSGETTSGNVELEALVPNSKDKHKKDEEIAA